MLPHRPALQPPPKEHHLPPSPPRRRLRAWSGAALTALLGLGTAVPAQAAVPARYDVVPGSAVLISEIANGGAGATSQSNRNSAGNFIEIENYGTSPADISGWKIYRCGQTGGGYGPQAVVPEGTVLAPGARFTAARDTSGYSADAYYDTSLHDFGFGAFLEDASGQRIDAVGFYAENVATDCAQQGRWLQRGLQHRLDESHQRVGTSGDVRQDWIIATRTPGEPNALSSTVRSVDNGLRITEFTNSGPAAASDQYVEVTNTGQTAVDMTGYQLFRCGENGTQYLQIGSVPTGSVVEPGASFVFGHAGAGEEITAVTDAAYSSGMHWRDFGVMLLTADEEIVDRAGVYNNRNSACTGGEPLRQKLNAFNGEVFQRIADTGSNAKDFAVTTTRTPGTDPAEPAITEAVPSEHTGLAISELAAHGPAGPNDEFVELANYGTAPVNLSGFSAYRCYGTGQPGIGTNVQVADLGDVTLAPGQTYLMAAAGAPAALRQAAQATYGTGLNHTEGYGMYVTDAQGALVDAVAVYDVNVDSETPCRLGQEVRNYTKSESGESVTRVQRTGDNELDYAMAPRTPGVLQDAPYIDPVVPLPGELDPVQLETATVPGTPKVSGGEGTNHEATVSVTDADGGALSLTTFTAPLHPAEGTEIRAGVSSVPVPASPQIAGEEPVEAEQSLTTPGTSTGYPFQRFDLPAPGAGTEFVWTGTAASRNEVQLMAWTGAAWERLAAGIPSVDGDLTLRAVLPEAAVSGGRANVLVIDGPRTSGGLLDEAGVTDQQFADPADYDFAVNHMTDTQFYSEGFRDVFRRMATWVVANADARKIEYNTLTGDIIENWMNGNHSPERADREFAAAKSIMGIINDAGIPNGVLPGNHDNMWGHNNAKYNSFFPVSMYEDKPWYGESWAPGDNSAHTDYFSVQGVDFLVISLPYRSSEEQMEWASAQAQAHPDHNVILATHSYVHTSGARDNVDLRYTATGVELWNTVIAPNDNVFLALGGHFHGTVTNYADPVTGNQVDATDVANQAYAISNVGATGRTVVEMLADYQGYRSTLLEDPTATRADALDRDTGFQRLLQFDLDAGVMAVNAYSPTLDSFEAWRYDEPGFRGSNARYDASDDEFAAAVSLRRTTDLATAGWAVTGPASVVDTAEAGSGVLHPVSFAPDAGDRLWFTEAVDGAGNEVRSLPRILTGSGNDGGAGDNDGAPGEGEGPGDGDAPGGQEPDPGTGPGLEPEEPSAAPQDRTDAGGAAVPGQRPQAVWPAGIRAAVQPAPDAEAEDRSEENADESEPAPGAAAPPAKTPAAAAPSEPEKPQADATRTAEESGFSLLPAAAGAAALLVLAGAAVVIARRRGMIGG